MCTIHSSVDDRDGVTVTQPFPLPALPELLFLETACLLVACLVPYSKSA